MAQRKTPTHQRFRYSADIQVLGLVTSACSLYPIALFLILVVHYILGLLTMCLIRVVHETHGSQTKKNKEWQEKLPVVVLKAEEIIYSKANSEEEYVNLDTLWDRLNDAINTIIRRDESTETGELLPPCVEAALNLGCIPVRASRSQRHSHPRTYLNVRPQELASLPPKIVDKNVEEQYPEFSPIHSGNQIDFARSSIKVNSTLPLPESSCQCDGNGNITAPPSYPLYENISSDCSKMIGLEASVPSKLGSVHPLHCGTQFQTVNPKFGSWIPENVNSMTIFVGKPVGTSIPEPVQLGALPRMFSCPASDVTSKPITKPDFNNLRNRPNIRECDLSLRLGLSGDSSMSTDRRSAHETENVGSLCYQKENIFNDHYPEQNKEFCFFPNKTAEYPHETCSS